MLAWGAKVSPKFRSKVAHIAVKGSFNPDWLMAAMAFETGETFSPSIQNPLSEATGLIQFLRSTAKGLGTSIEALLKMSAEEQLDWVEKYFDPYLGRIKSLADCYMAIFWPAAIGKPDNYPLITDAESKAYVQNKGLDLNKDGNITKAEAASLVAKKLERGLRPEFASIDDRAPRPERDTIMETSQRPSILDGIGDIASMLNPIAGIIFKAFSPLVKEKIAAEVNRHTDTPGVGQAVADSLSKALESSAIAETGRADPLEAAAVIIQPEHAEKLKAVEQAATETVSERLKQLQPLLRDTADIDKAKWDAERQGKNDAASRAIKEHEAGVYDMTRILIWFAGVTSTVMVLMLTIAIVYQAIFASDVNTALVGLAGPLLAIAMGVWREIFAYRFDGNKDSSAQTQAVLNMSESAKGTK